mgnify:CR=1 FL=1
MQNIKLQSNLNQLNLICSIDCWGSPAEYVRNGLDLNLFEQNFNYVLHNTDIVLNINSALGPLTIPTMPDLVDKINKWSQVRTVYWSLTSIEKDKRSCEWSSAFSFANPVN